MTRTSERSPLASAVIATIDGRGSGAADSSRTLPPSCTTEITRPVELEPERRQRDRLHVAHDLLRVLALMRDDVHFGDATVGFGDEPNDRDVGQPTDLPFDFREVQFVHADCFPLVRASTIGRRGVAYV